MKKIITLDWNQRLSDPATFVGLIDKAFRETGFLKLKNHGMNLEAIKNGENAFREFLKILSLKNRMQYHYPDKHGQIGYTPLNVEIGEHAKVADEKHFYHVFPRDSPYVGEIVCFKSDTDSMWEEFHKLCVEFMKYVAIAIDEIHDFFSEKQHGMGYSLLRGLHYPAREKVGSDMGEITEGGNAVGMCAAPHTDINLITILLAKEPGLELFGGKKWYPVTIDDPNELIVNCGDMLRHLTNGYYKSGIHRVVCKENRERFSQPFFYHPVDDFPLLPLPQFGKPKEEFHFETAGKFLHHRLKQIGLLK